MKKSAVLGSTFVILAAALMIIGAAVPDDSSDAAQGPGTPIAVFNHVKHTWQSAIEGEKIKHTFRVRNKGNAELIIEQVRTS